MDKIFTPSMEKLSEESLKEEDRQLDKYGNATLEEINEQLERVSKINEEIERIKANSELDDEQKKEEIDDLLIFEPIGDIDYAREKEILLKVKTQKEAENGKGLTETSIQQVSESDIEKQTLSFIELKNSSEDLLNKMNQVVKDLSKMGKKDGFDLKLLKERFNTMIGNLEIIVKVDENKLYSFLDEGKYDKLLKNLGNVFDKFRGDADLAVKEMKNLKLSGVQKDYIDNQIAFLENEVNHYFSEAYKSGLIKELIVVAATDIGV